MSRFHPSSWQLPSSISCSRSDYVQPWNTFMSRDFTIHVRPPETLEKLTCSVPFDSIPRLCPSSYSTTRLVVFFRYKRITTIDVDVAALRKWGPPSKFSITKPSSRICLRMRKEDIWSIGNAGRKKDSWRVTSRLRFLSWMHARGVLSFLRRSVEFNDTVCPVAVS